MPQNQIPLLLWNNSIEKIIEDSTEPTFKYDYLNQVVEYDCASIGTKSLKVSQTRKKGAGGVGFVGAVDRKNEIDDSKTKK